VQAVESCETEWTIKGAQLSYRTRRARSTVPAAALASTTRSGARPAEIVESEPSTRSRGSKFLLMTCRSDCGVVGSSAQRDLQGLRLRVMREIEAFEEEGRGSRF